jgi:hypothetical protein
MQLGGREVAIGKYKGSGVVGDDFSVILPYSAEAMSITLSAHG